MKHPLRDLIRNNKLMKELAEEYGTPCYVYDQSRLIDNLTKPDIALSKYFSKYHICYAVKSNSNPHLLKTMLLTLPHLGADCSSPGEIYVAEKAGINTKNCIYTGNYESMEDLSIALEKKCYINLDDPTSFDRLSTIKLPERISFRLNPGFGKGEFSGITTAGNNAKFGIPADKIISAYSKAKDSNITHFGLQCMAGSGNLEENHFIDVMTAILYHSKKIEAKLNINFEFISMGGGLGIPYNEDELHLNYDNLFERLSDLFYKAYPNKEKAPSLWIEPGKSIVGDTGFILSTVTGIKNSYKNFIGLDAGMETLMRPALYGAFHQMFKVGIHGENVGTFDFTGPICENTDRIAYDREFPQVNEGDLIAILDAGAYGYSMSHNFNTRPRAAEILLHGKSHRLIRRRETIKDIFSGCDV